MPHTIISNEGESNITVFIPGEPGLFTAHSDHPNFKAIVALCVEGREAESLPLFDLAQTVSERFERLSERVTVANGRVYFDGDEVDSSLTKLIVRALDEGADFRSLVAFFENVSLNPNDHSRTQLFDWLRARDFTITPDGLIVGYKGVSSDGNGGYQSGFSGRAIVDGQAVNGRIPNAVGSVIEMPRTSVAHDPAAACSTGLHVGTFEYAQGYAQGAMLEVHVNPRDVVSVPTDAAGEKVRVCRYTVVDVIDAPHSAAVLSEDEWDEYAEQRGDAGLAYDDDDDLDVGVVFVSTERDPKGRFVAGRPSSQRDPRTGRFAG
jgi:hypothetical protein